MALWSNRSAGTAARNGTTSHTITFTAASSGNLLVAVVAGPVTTAWPVGWTEQLQPVNSVELSVATKTATAGENSVTVTHNAANYSVQYVIYEFPAGSTWGQSATSTGTATSSTAMPTATGLPGSGAVEVFFAVAGGISSSTLPSATWSAGPTGLTEDLDAAAAFSTNDGPYLSVAYADNVTTTTATATCTLATATNTSVVERVVFSVNVVTGPSVSAGVDATVTATTLFSRTATESNLTSVSARNWEIVSGPAGAVSSIGTAAALSWTPTATGSYVLRYSAVHSTGTATDDVTVTVVNPTPTLVLDRGTVANATAATTSSVSLTSPTTIATGNYLIARVAVDNSGASGAAPGCTVTDPRSNTWTVLGPALVDPGAAAAGATAYIAHTKVVTAYQAADALTFNWGGISTTAKAVVVEEWTYIHDTTPIAVTAVTNDSGTAASTTAVSVAITPTAADQMVYTCLATEGIAGDSFTGDADTTNGTWATLTTTASANATATNNQRVMGQYKQVSASGAQTWNATITSRDWAALAVVFAPSPAAVSQTVTPAVAGSTGAAVAGGGSVATPTGPAQGTGQAPTASFSTASLTTTQAGTATATGDAPDPAVAQSSAIVAGLAAATGQAPAATDRVTPAPAVAGATGQVPAATAVATAAVTVVAGRARPVVNGAGVVLDVTATPPGGETISGYSWSITSGGGSLTNATTATPTWTAPASGNGSAVIRATVTGSGGAVGTADNTVSYHATIVAAENALTGVARATWDLPTTALGGIATLQGFADGFSFDRTETVNFKIAQSDAAGWTANLYRLGYYGGNGARDYGAVTPSGGQVTTSQAQPTSLDADPNTTLKSADCSNWSVSLTWTPPAWAPSGIYILRLNRTGGGASHVMFIVRDDARAADLMLMPSDSTWNAYNAFRDMGTTNWLAGNSLYLGTAVDQYNADCARFVSYNRPVVNRQAATSGVSYGAVEWSTFFTGEYPMMRFVERNGIDVKYYGCIDAAGDATGTHLTGNGSTRGAVGAAMMVGHNEYWSSTMRAGWETAKAAGVNLFVCAANEVFWRLIGSDNDSAGRPRTWECFKSTIAARASTGRTEWTGTWRDPDGAGKGGNNPENLLTGTIFVTNGPDLRSLVVPFAGGYSAQPIWRNTSVASLTTGQSYTSPAEIVGFEWDTYGPAGTDNTASAACLAAPNARARYCSTATYNTSQQLQDAGDVYGTGNNTHRLVVHPNDGGNGGFTFGTGTINWALGVDDSNTYQMGSDNTDVVIQQATVNMLADMGAVAATLMGTLTAPTPVTWFADYPAGTATATGTSSSPTLRISATTSATVAGSTAVANNAAAGSGALWGAPPGLTATVISGTRIDLSWGSVTEAAGYDIERDGSVIATDVVGTSYSDTGLSPGVTYTYRARSVRA